MSDEEAQPKYDSMAADIAAAKRLANSTRLKLLLATVWAGVIYLKPIVVPAFFVLCGWVAKSFQVDSLKANIVAEGEKTRNVLRQELGTYKLEQQQRIFAIGRQAAYARGAAMSGEQPKVAKLKKADAEKFAAEYERLALKEGRDPQTIYAWIFDPPPQ